MVSLPLPTWRAGTRPGQRVRLAAAFERLVRDARRTSSPPLAAKVPLRAEAVRCAAPELLSVAATLRSTTHPSAFGVAAARRLLTDPAGPIYTDDGSDLRLVAQAIEHAIEEA